MSDLVKVLIVTADAGAGSALAARMNADGRFAADSATGVEAVPQALAQTTYRFVLIAGFFAGPEGYGPGSPAAKLIDEHIRNRYPFGRMASVPHAVPVEYRGSFEVVSYPPPPRLNNGDDLEDRIMAAVSVS